MNEKKYELGTVVKMKKTHPCGKDEFQIIRNGVDIKIKCLNCHHIIMLPRIEFEKKIKMVVKND